MVTSSFHPHQPLHYAIPIVVVVALIYMFSDDAADMLYSQILGFEGATCGEFRAATANAQTEYLKDCDCLGEGDNASKKANPVMSVPPADIETCVRAAIAVCTEDDSLHQIYRSCAISKEPHDQSG